jgi:signal transduction histidine kinase
MERRAKQGLPVFRVARIERTRMAVVQRPPGLPIPTLSPGRAASDARRDLASTLDERGAEIVGRWEAEMRGLTPDPAAAGLRPGLPEYLAGLASALRREGPVSESAAAVWQAVANRHQLADSGEFDLDGMIQQLIVLRRAIHAVTRAGSQEERDLTADLIDAGVAQVASSYVHQRDRQARQVRADHIGFVTHELRNPLTAAMVAASRLRPEVPAVDWPPAVTLVQRSLKRVAGLIDTFLVSEQFEAERIHPHPVNILIGEIVSAAVAPSEEAAARPEVRVSASLDPVAVVRVDPPLTIAAIQNVIANAVQFTDAGKVSIEVEERGDRLILHVRDNCKGIPAEAAEKIFQPFFPSHPGKTIPGLGLALARRVMEAQGGSIDVESESGGGCHFLIALPRKSGEVHGTHSDRR